MADVHTLPPPQYPALPSRRQEVEYVVLADAEGTTASTLQAYVRLFWHRKWLVLLPVLCLMPWLGLSVATQVPRYSATAVVLIEDTNPKILAIPEVAVAPEKSPNFYSTQYEIIKSRAIAEEVVDKLHLDTPPPAPLAPPQLTTLQAIKAFPGRVWHAVLARLSPCPGGRHARGLDVRRAAHAAAASGGTLTDGAGGRTA